MRKLVTDFEERKPDATLVKKTGDVTPALERAGSEYLKTLRRRSKLLLIFTAINVSGAALIELVSAGKQVSGSVFVNSSAITSTPKNSK